MSQRRRGGVAVLRMAAFMRQWHSKGRRPTIFPYRGILRRLTPVIQNMTSVLILTCVLGAVPITHGPPSGLPLTGAEAEEFLRSAEIVEMNRIPIGVSKPQRVTLTDTTLTLNAVWKTIDRFEPMTRLEHGKVQMSFRDSYQHEIAAYELDKLIGLNMVPPTVERRIDGIPGSLQMWVEGGRTEKERKELKLHPENIGLWNDQILKVRLFHHLVSDSDYNNIRNLLSDRNFQVYIIDSSRAFRIGRKLRNELALDRFSRTLLERLHSLDPGLLEEHLGQWLSRQRIRALLERRDRILDLARALVAERGEAAVLYD